MKKLLLACVAGATALATVTPAEAHPDWHYQGGCGSFALGDGTDSPQTRWDGEIHVTAVAMDAAGTPAPTASITVDCELRINGATPGTIVFSCSTPGTGFVACAEQFSFHADPDDVVTICDLVTVNGELHKDCHEEPSPPIIPQPIQDAIEEHVWPRVDEVEEFVDRFVGRDFPPPGFAVTAVAWSMDAGDPFPAFTPPPATSHPANWSCTTSYPSATTARAECLPTDPPDPGTTGWACWDPFVDVTIRGPLQSDVGGMASCGTTVASCTASTGLAGVGHCSDWALPRQPVPLVCEADYSAVVPGSSWTVRCAPIDP